MLTESQQERTTSRVMRPYSTLPHHTKWDEVQRGPYLQAMPDTLKGLLRQFTARALDIGKTGFDDPERYASYRSQIFDARDQLMALLTDWLLFWDMTDVDGGLNSDVFELLMEQADEKCTRDAL